MRLTWAVALLAVAGAGSARCTRPSGKVVHSQYVIQISMDGLGSAWLEPLLKAGDLPNFARLEREGAWTHNAPPTMT